MDDGKNAFICMALTPTLSVRYIEYVHLVPFPYMYMHLAIPWQIGDYSIRPLSHKA